MTLVALADIKVGGIKDLFGGPLFNKKCFEVGPDLLSSFEYTAAILNLKYEKIYNIKNYLLIIKHYLFNKKS